MSSYTDADANRLSDQSSSNFVGKIDDRSLCNLLEHRLKSICFDPLNPKTHASHVDRSGRTIFFFCLILMIVYFKLICLSYPMINDIYSKDEYFRRELPLEQDKIRHQKKEFEQRLGDWKRQVNPNDISCRKCFSLISQINIEDVLRILDNQQHVKDEYDEYLLPFQSLLIFLCLLNNLSIVFIFQRALKFFLLSNILLLICLGIHAEFFIQHRPSVFYTLTIAVFIHLFTVFLLFHVLKTFVIIQHYQRMKKTLTSLQ